MGETQLLSCFSRRRRSVAGDMEAPDHGISSPYLLTTNSSPQTIDDSTMAKIAAEMNLSETAFVYPLKELVPFDFELTWKKSDVFGLRWFTPTKEVNLCGHATLATAAALKSRGTVRVIVEKAVIVVCCEPSL